MAIEDFQQFEDSVHRNGDVTWSAREFSEFLGYASYQGFRGAIGRAQRACLTLGISLEENFRLERSVVGGRETEDYRLSRFACYLTAMNADPKKEKVAQSQVYFAGLAEAVYEYALDAPEIERVLTRADITDQEKSLSGTAKSHGVVNYGYFQSAGYRGMYNMTFNRLKEIKRVPKGKTVLDFMHNTELAANLFRITQTDEKIRNEDIRGQRPLENAANEVGKTVRATMVKLSGTTPEELPPAGDIQRVKRVLVATQKDMKKVDAPGDN